MSEDHNGPIQPNNPLLWGAVVVSLLTGGTSSIATLSTRQEMDDRFRGSDWAREKQIFEKELEVKDEQIASLRREFEKLQIQVQKIDDTHPPPAILRELRDHEERLRAAERYVLHETRK